MDSTMVYLYPKIDYRKAVSPNPYITDFESALGKNCQVVNTYYNNQGVLDLYRHIFATDKFVLNWIEDLPKRRFGKIQVIFFLLFLITCKLMGKKIVWVLHNKYSHNQKKNGWTDLMFSVMIKYADLIFTHSRDGVDFVGENYPAYAGKVRYIIHPVRAPFPLIPQDKKDIDLLIWGTVTPYKGILQFLQFVNANPDMAGMRILILGKCPDQEYKKQVEAYLSEKIVYQDAFFEMEQIAEMAARSRFILFTYKNDSVLSSGSLMDSIRMRTPIIGPSHGAFQDLSDHPFIATYNHFTDIVELVRSYVPEPATINQAVDNFCRQNSWHKFGLAVERELCSI